MRASNRSSVPRAEVLTPIAPLVDGVRPASASLSIVVRWCGWYRRIMIGSWFENFRKRAAIGVVLCF